MRLKSVCLLPFSLAFMWLTSSPVTSELLGASERPTSPLQLESSDGRLLEAFGWAKKQAMDYVQSANDPVGLWYETGLPGRIRFSMRDTAHQSMGAQALGLAPYTLNMLHHFAQDIAAARGWCSYWGIDRWNRPARVDYKNDAEFWYDLPANFDVLDASYRMFLWTGDMTYINDPVFLNFYQRSLSDYVNTWQLGADQVMHRGRMNIPEVIDPHVAWPTSRGIPGYQENPRDYVVGVDLLAAEYQAFLAYAYIAEYNGNTARAQTFRDQAAKLKHLINDGWWNPQTHRFYSILDKDYHLTASHSPLDDVNVELLYRDAAEDGPKLEGAVQALLENIRSNPSGKVEGESHFPEVLYRYGQPESAYQEIMDLTRPDKPRREYPEVSYSVVGAIVTGLMGIHLDAPPPSEAQFESNYTEVIVDTLPALTRETAWAEIRNLPMRTNMLDVRHDGNRQTTFSNQRGPSLYWQAEFPGTYQLLLVDGKPQKATTERLSLGRSITWVRIPVGSGDTITVKTPES